MSGYFILPSCCHKTQLCIVFIAIFWDKFVFNIIVHYKKQIWPLITKCCTIMP